MRYAARFMVLVVLLAGCSAKMTQYRYSLEPQPNTCQVNEVRPTWHSTITATVCWDQDGRPIGMGSATGKAIISTPIDIAGVAATLAGPIAGAVILSNGVTRAAHELNAVTVTGTVKVKP